MPKRVGMMTVAELEQILDDRKSKALELRKRREDLQRQIEQIDRQILALMGGKPLGPRRRRLKNELPLRSHVLKILSKSKRGYSMAELTTQVTKSGYKSASHNFRNVLYQCLYNTKNISFDPATGRYKLK